MKLTPWFPPEVKPVRVGMYQCKMCIGMNFSRDLHYWNGENWWYARNHILGDPLRNVTWRGLARKP